MLKYTGKYWAVLAPLIKKSLKKHYGRDFADRTMKRAKVEYKAMLRQKERSPSRHSGLSPTRS